MTGWFIANLRGDGAAVLSQRSKARRAMLGQRPRAAFGSRGRHASRQRHRQSHRRRDEEGRESRSPLRRFPRELTNRGGRVPAVAGNGGKPATRGDYQRWRGSDKPVRHVRNIQGSVARMMPPKRYLSQQDEGGRKAARWGERRCNPQNPKQSARRKDQGKIAPNTPPDKSRTRSNEAPRTRQGTSQST